MASKKSQRHSDFIIAIQSIGSGGDGVGYYEDRPVYVPKTAPGDLVRVQFQNERVDAIDGRLLDLITPSPDRVSTPSPYYAACGGCSLQHVSEDFYRSWKIDKLRKSLERVNITPQRWGVPVFLQAGTRRRTVLSAVRQGPVVRLGYHAPRSHEITDVRACPILTPALDEFAQKLRPYLPRLLPDKKPLSIMIQQVDGQYDVVFSGPLTVKGDFTLEQREAFGEMAQAVDIARLSFREKEYGPIEPLLTRHDIFKNFGPLRVALPPGAFLQASDEGERALCKEISAALPGARRVADLFSGCGTFTGEALRSGAHVIAVESDRAAVNALQNTAAARKDLKVQQRDLFKEPLSPRELTEFDAVLFDPPRAGAAAQCQMLAQSIVPRLIAVSCNPGSFARDAKILSEGGYVCQSVTLVDQFVWSSHVELVAVFQKA